MSKLTIYCAQIAPVVGDLAGNAILIKNTYQQAVKNQADICLLGELVLSGYMAEDLFLRPAFLKQIEQEVISIVATTTDCLLLLSVPWMINNKLHNAVLYIAHGSIVHITSKVHLPNTGVFDECRYFSSGTNTAYTWRGCTFAALVCEDIWHPDVIANAKAQRAEVILVLNASPFSLLHQHRREQIIAKRHQETGLPIIYCNQVLAHDGLVFAGQSFIWHQEQKQFELALLKPDACLVDYSDSCLSIISRHNAMQNFTEEELLYSVIVFALRSYVHHNGFNKILLGLSGGIDSALVAALAVDALGSENVSLCFLPYIYTSEASIEDAAKIAELLGITLTTLPITQPVAALTNLLPNISSLATENLQARMRGLVLMSLANTHNSLLLTTGNKSENATGYATLYGDMCGAFNPIKDLYKKQVVALCRYRNQYKPQLINCLGKATFVMPVRVIEKEPSAELRAAQKDSDSLPPYHILDEILYHHIELYASYQDLINLGYEAQTISKVLRLVQISEYKRRQAAIGVRLSDQSFDRDRRYPITNLWRDVEKL